MPLVIGVLLETHPGERRLSVVPDVVKKYQGLGAQVVMQKDAGKGAHFRDADFADVSFVDTAEEVAAAAVVLGASRASPTRITAPGISLMAQRIVVRGVAQSTLRTVPSRRPTRAARAIHGRAARRRRRSRGRAGRAGGRGRGRARG